MLGLRFARTPWGDDDKGRRLTSEEIDQEVQDITTRPWPHNSVLPVKNLYDRRLGAIFRTHDGGPETIIAEIIFPDNTKPVAFENLRAMVEAGWVAD